MRHRATTSELSASTSAIDKAILAERRRVLGLVYSLKRHLADSVFGRLRTMIEAGEDLEAAAENDTADRPLMIDWPSEK